MTFEDSRTSLDQTLAGLGVAASTLALGQTLPDELLLAEQATGSVPDDSDKALIAITFDLEMSMHYPTWDQMEWNYEQGLLDDLSEKYTVEAARRVKATGGRMQLVVVGRVFEQENVDWLQELHREGTTSATTPMITFIARLQSWRTFSLAFSGHRGSLTARTLPRLSRIHRDVRAGDADSAGHFPRWVPGARRFQRRDHPASRHSAHVNFPRI